MNRMVSALLCTDENYFFNTLITAWSIHVNNTKIQIDILINFDLSLFDQLLKSLNSSFKKTISFIDISSEFDLKLANVPSYTDDVPHISGMAYGRILSTEILDRDIVYYFDSDVIVDYDITKIVNKYQNHINEKSILGVNNYFIAPRFWTNVYSKYNLTDEVIRNVINSGAIIMNFKRLKKLNFSNNAIKWLEKTKEKWMDQAAINVLLGSIDEIYRIDSEYNWGVHKDDLFRIESKWAKPKIYHFASSNKPWNSSTKYNDIFNKYIYSFEKSNKNLINFTDKLKFIKKIDGVEYVVFPNNKIVRKPKWVGESK